MHLILACPVCNAREFQRIMTCEDHTVSHETFHLDKCLACHLVITNPQPDEEKLSKYYLSETYVSHAKTARSFLDRIYRIARFFTIKWKYALLTSHTIEKKTIMDFGCGTGDFLAHCQRQHHKVIGVEPSHIAREISADRTRQPIHKDLSTVTEKVNIITAWHVIEHVPNLNQTFQQLQNHLAKNGTMFIAVPNHQSFDAEIYKEFWAGYDVPRHLWHFSKENMTRLLHNSGMELIKIVPMKLDAFYVSMLSEKHRNGKLTLHALANALRIGMLSNLRGKSKKNQSSLVYIARKK
jgi:2-polyprenyl-3-methyl-5-hydroxy-6-metoxy-1,4-benzoquinol methylase